MTTRRLSSFAFILAAATSAACFDPLFEEGLPLVGTWSVCCVAGSIDTCECTLATCAFEFRACAASTCVAKATACSVPGGRDAGVVTDAGIGPDAGTSADAGVNLDAGIAPVIEYVACCLGGFVGSCGCTSSPCSAKPFVSCRQGTCVEGAGAVCP